MLLKKHRTKGMTVLDLFDVLMTFLACQVFACPWVSNIPCKIMIRRAVYLKKMPSLHDTQGSPSSKIHRADVGSIMVHCLRRWPNIDPTSAQCILVAVCSDMRRVLSISLMKNTVLYTSARKVMFLVVLACDSGFAWFSHEIRTYINISLHVNMK